MTKSRNIFVLNLLLCVAIVAVVAVALARRHAPPVQVPPTEQAAISDVHPAVIPKSSVEDWDDTATLDAESAALRDEIAGLKGKIADEDRHRKEIEEANYQKFQTFLKKVREQQQAAQMDSPPISLAFDDLVEKREEFPDIYERIAEQILLDAQERIEARQVLRDCLSEAELDEQQRIKVLAYLDELDEFDRNLSIQNFHPEELPNNLEIFVLLREKAFANQPKITLENLTGAILNPMFFAFKKMEDAR